MHRVESILITDQSSNKSKQENHHTSSVTSASRILFTMKVIASLLPLLALALQGASAAPAEQINIPVPFGTNADIVLRVCDHADFGGRCEDLRSAAQRCYNLGNGWPDTITSARTGAGKICYLYEHNNCRGRHVELYGGGTGHQNLNLQNMNDKISSYRCS